MASKLELLMEADRRGILPPDKKAMLDEAKKRGLVDKAARDLEVRTKGATDYTGGLGKSFSQFTNLVMDPFGVRDEMIGAGAAARKFVTSGFDTDAAGSAYTDASERVRAEQRAAREDYGIVPEIVGGLGTTGIAKGFQMAPTLLGRVGQSAKAGAGFGGAATVGHGEGFLDRVTKGAEGAAVGAVLSPAVTEVAAPIIGTVARATKKGASAIADATRALRGNRSNVDARLNRALAQQNLTPRQAQQRIDEARQAATFGKAELDPQFTIADTGPVTGDLADTASLISREARGHAGEFLNDRSRGQFGRINDYLQRALQVTRKNFAKTQAKLVTDQQKLSGKAYSKAYADPKEYDVGQVLFDTQFDEAATAGPLNRALKRARSLFIDPGRAPGLQARLNTQRFDSGKRALDDMIQGARNAGRNNEARMLTDLKHKLLDVIDNPTTGNPLYKEARDVYSSRAELLDSLDEGRKFLRGDAEMTGAQYRALSTGERRMFRIGMAREMRKLLGNKKLGHDMISVFDKPNTREVLAEIMTPKQAEKFYQLVDIEEAMSQTSRAVRGNSKTAQRQQDVLDFSFGVRLGRSIKDKGLREALFDEVSDQITKLFAMREGDALRVTQALFETDPEAQRQILARLQKTYGKTGSKRIMNRAERIVRQRLARQRRTLAGVAGERATEFVED